MLIHLLIPIVFLSGTLCQTTPGRITHDVVETAPPDSLTAGVVAPDTPATAGVEPALTSPSNTGTPKPPQGPCDNFIYCHKKGFMNTSAVCGTDGKTYDNDCYFRQAQCQYKQDGYRLVRFNWGQCPSGSNTELKQLPVTQDCRGKLNACRGDSKGKGGTNKAVCASDGKTYASSCLIDLFNCHDHTLNLMLMSIGKCAENVTGTTDTCSMNCAYKAKVSFVCGTDGRSYKNMCYLERYNCQAAKEGHPAIKVAYIGHCDRPGVPTDVNCDETPDACPCPTYFVPLCGSDGKTYDNSCFFTKAECTALKKGERLTILRHSPCRKSIVVGY